ncbi:hypothetical protein M1K46_18945 [Fictibacillus sp. WQ 8-8]|uniref:hypothetical protein n=1 Tax=unclassified Fictibacillus TaxID=2644029 RepID=UPI0006A79B1D|nr:MULTISPECIES: hypothetical protein [unclassified Fictibacillus]MCQ6267712.1 hypothetical protein [Fictibacillus sp. WQ 8-8]MED2974507.1 hypothetical protein [Fictibacillus sp. B-59209]SFE32427.1 hypothetical protein SAMN05428981_1059 [Bacillus sp. OV194]
MKRFHIFISLIIMLFASMPLLSPTAYAAEKNIMKSKEVVIPFNQSVENVIVFGHDAVIKGKVKTAVIVFNGDVNIKRQAKIKELVLVVGGHVKQEPGSNVTENIVSINLDSPSQNSLFLGGMVLVGGWLMRLIGSIVLVLLTILAGLSLNKRFSSFAEITKGKAARFILSGAITSLAILILSLLLGITVIGIPISIILLLFPLISFIAGMAVLSKETAKRIAGLENKPAWIVYLTGSFLIVSIFNFPVIGGIVFFILYCLSLGMSIQWLYSRLRRGK